MEPPRLDAIAKAAGLSPRVSGQRIRFFCPACATDRATRRREGRTVLGRIDGGWRCQRASCGEKGGARQLLALTGQAPTPEPAPQPVAPDAGGRQARPGRPNVDAAWQDLSRVQGPRHFESIYRWCIARGWSESLAERVASQGDVLIVAGGQSAAARQLEQTAQRWGRRLGIPIRGAWGRVRSAALRWAGDGIQPTGPKTLSLPARLVGRSEEWGGVMLYGSIPAAVRAALDDRPIVLVEGAPDYLSAGAMFDRLGGAEVLGAYSAQTMPAVARELARQLGDAEAIARDVLIVPHADRPTRQAPRGAGAEAADAAAAELHGRAGVRVVRLPTGADPRSASRPAPPPEPAGQRP